MTKGTKGAAGAGARPGRSTARPQGARLERERIWLSLRAAAAPALGLVVLAFFGGYALFGANGALAWSDYSRRLAQRNVELTRLEGERDRLAHRVQLLDPAHADRDLADELARRDLGVSAPDEVIVPLR